MPDYKAPLRDIRFVRNELLGYAAHYRQLPGCEEASPEMVEAILTECARFAQDVLAPLNAIGDREGCTWSADGVQTPAGFKAAFEQYVAGGWPSLSHEAAHGGQGLPDSLDMAVRELIGEANWAWGMYPGLSQGAMNTLKAHGTPEQQKTYLEPLVAGRWTATMCLTEPQCGTDLGLLRTRAEPQPDGSYHITGNKIFISAGEHDLAANIVHIVLARLPDAPSGTRGISLFVVPKFLPDAQGEPGARNSVSCGAIEHKMGIHGNATCVMNFDGATGFMVGQPNLGLRAMFTFMNMARLGTALQGLAHAEVAWQGACAYALQRRQGRALSGPADPGEAADLIVVHPDVRRMLLTIRAFAEGNRALLYFAAQQVDIQRFSADAQQREMAETLLGFLTPIAKAFMTETGFEAANLGLQVWGGHGYITENGMEQNVRDSRIACLYEGTTGVQALDLLGRKVLLSQGESLRLFTRIVHEFCQAHGTNPALADFIAPLAELNGQWGELTQQIGMSALADREAVGAAAYDYLMFSGYVVLAYFWADMARVAAARLAAGDTDAMFYQAKVDTAHFYFARILPRTRVHASAMRAGPASLMRMPIQAFMAGSGQ
ncbi:acyl-CoA dehydrogenase C-terminal domain-containing protein [Castellaniella sp.]|uniref:acyl-CoA dehydrogenase C-terminal domain-containing protein n=1 Tax=Castellaniella sp. TaxID=1955812 RepID=UPI00355D9E84